MRHRDERGGLALAEAPGGAPKATDAPVEWLIDNADAYAAVVGAIRGARHSISISQLAFDADCIGYGADDGADVLLLDVLVSATREHGLKVRVLLNESLLVDTAAPLREHLARIGCTEIDVRGISRFPQLLHAKMLIVDGAEALLLGSPFVNGYWDDSVHRPTDARRPMRELGGRPLHDLSVRVTGSAVAALAEHFDEWWSEVATDRLASEASGPKPSIVAAAAPLEVLATVPKRVLAHRRDGRTEILPRLEAGIASARRLLYVEHQYLSSRRVIAAVHQVLAAQPALQVIVLLNQNPDVTAYRGWQNQRMREAGLTDHPRVGLFSPWTAEPDGEGGWSMSQVFVHSKVVIADDRWAMVGSANLDGVSLHSYGHDFASRLGQRIFREVRNFDIALELNAWQEQAGAPCDLRERLWTEHLGGPDATSRRLAGASMDRWRSACADNVATLNRSPVQGTGARIIVLPYSSAATPRGQLTALGVKASSTTLRFTPGWLEVHCSPNWIRNMFA